MKYDEIINTLYHATSVGRLYEILEDDEIKSNTYHPITHTGGENRTRNWSIRPKDITPNGYMKGVSLTRSKTFARMWTSKADTDYKGNVILVLNGNLLKRDYRIIPVDFWNQTSGRRLEAEEFVLGSIKPLSKYLIQIETIKDVTEKNSLLLDITTLFPSHPKLVIR